MNNKLFKASLFLVSMFESLKWELVSLRAEDGGLYVWTRFEECLVKLAIKFDIDWFNLNWSGNCLGFIWSIRSVRADSVGLYDIVFDFNDFDSVGEDISSSRTLSLCFKLNFY